MTKPTAIQHCLSYMEEHLDEDLSVAEIAAHLGYSLYYFCRMFKSIMGQSPGAWLRQRRLSQAAERLLQGQNITQTALDSGYDTPSGFNKAFRRRFGLTPSKFIQKGGFIMEPKFTTIDTFSAIGYCLKPDPSLRVDPLEDGAYWLGQDFSSVSREEYASLTYPGYAEICCWLHPDALSGELYYFCGPTVKSKAQIPKGMVAIDIPGGEYAVFPVPPAADLSQLAEEVRHTWKYIFGQWLPASSCSFNEQGIDFECYQGDKVFICLPIKR